MIATFRFTAARHVALNVFVLCGACAHGAAVVVDDAFEDGMNPNGWIWTNTQEATLTDAGGNPGAWVDTGLLYLARHPAFLAEPAPGTPLAIALASGRLRSASIDLQRIDESGVQGCQQTHLDASFVSLALFDLHTNEQYIWAHTTADASPSFPAGAFPWVTASFIVPPPSTDTPAGWTLHVPPGVPYTWADMLANIDDIRFYVGDPEPLAPSSCSHLGADNAVVTYDDEQIFADGFDQSVAPESYVD